MIGRGEVLEFHWLLWRCKSVCIQAEYNATGGFQIRRAVTSGTLRFSSTVVVLATVSRSFRATLDRLIVQCVARALRASEY